MRFRVLPFALFAAAVLATGIGIWSANADEVKRVQPTAIAVPPSDSATNTVTFRPRENGLKQLEQDLFKPFEKIAPKGSLEGAFMPSAPEPNAPAPAIQSKRAKELLERRRDWVFETPEEILSATTADNAANRKDKDDDSSKLSPIQRFYERLYHKDEKESTRSSAKKRDQVYNPLRQGSLSGDLDSDDDDASLPFAIRETQREMKKLLMPKERKDEFANPFSDAFGLGKPRRSTEEIETQRERMDQYKQLLGLPVTPGIETDPLKQFRAVIGGSPQNPTAVPTMNTLGTLPQGMFATQPGAAFGSGMKSLLPEGAQIHNDTPSLAPALPKVEPPKSLPPPVSFSAPRRSF